MGEVAETPTRKRKLPYVGENQIVRIDGLGVFVGQTVGNTSYTTGIDVYAHLDGAEEPLRGHARYKVAIRKSGAIEWDEVGWYGWGRPEIISDEVIQAMRGVAESLLDREPTGYVFSVMSAADMELRNKRYEVEKLESGIEHLTALLADPEEPRQPKNPKFHLTPIEQSQRRLEWARSLPKYRHDLERFHTNHDARIAMLTRISQSLRARCHAGTPERDMDIRVLLERAAAS